MSGGSTHHGGAAPRGRRPLVLVASLLLACSTLTALAGPASASPQDTLTAKRSQAQRLQARIEANQRRADALDEKYLEAKSAVEDSRRKIADAEAGIARAEGDANHAKTRLHGRAATLYMGAGNNDPLAIDATDVRELGARAKYGEAAADDDQRLLDKLNVAEEQLGIQRTNFQRIQDEARKQQKAADDALAEVKQAVSEDQHMLDGVQGDIKDLVNQIAVDKDRADERAPKRRSPRCRRRRGPRRPRPARPRSRATRRSPTPRRTTSPRRARVPPRQLPTRGRSSASPTDTRVSVRTRTTARGSR